VFNTRKPPTKAVISGAVKAKKIDEARVWSQKGMEHLIRMQSEVGYKEEIAFDE
jgi:hypothetical protein